MFIPQSLRAACLLLAFATSAAYAQLQVSLDLSRRAYIAYEPVKATVKITNLAGRDVTLQDSGSDRWFSFRIVAEDENVIGARDADYHLDPLTIPAGRTVERVVNLVSLYPVTEFGDYRVQASIFFAGADRYFMSAAQHLQITEGRQVWKQNLGVPAGQDGAGSTRTVTLLAFRKPKEDMLYGRVEDETAGIVYNTFPIGRMLNSGEPGIEVDVQNQVHVLQLVGPKLFLATTIGLNGAIAEQKVYTSVKYPPHLVRTDAGEVQVKGGQVYVAPTQQANAAAPKLSDRPKNMPLD